jgi:hypothetical protein
LQALPNILANTEPAKRQEMEKQLKGTFY